MYRPVYKQKGKRPTCIDLFSGAGGLSLGFAMAGGNPVGAVDIDKDSIGTYKDLFPFAANVHLGDITSWSPNAPLKVDLVIGGPPCQGFSLARGLRFVDDPRNHLYKDFIRTVALCKPSWFVMENVQGITNIGGGIILQNILEDFEKIGYQTECKIVNMAEYGVPQLRKRAIFVGTSTGRKFLWPDATHKNKKTKNDLFRQLPNFNSVNDALGDLDLLRGNYFAHRANSQMRGPRNRCAHSEPAFTLRVRGDEFALCEEPATSAFVPGGKPDEPSAYLEAQTPLQEFYRSEAPSYLEKDGQHFGKRKRRKNLKGTRRLTVREQARLQGFPDWVRFRGTEYSQSKQIGNAVPPLFAMQLFQSIFD